MYGDKEPKKILGVDGSRFTIEGCFLVILLGTLMPMVMSGIIYVIYHFILKKF